MPATFLQPPTSLHRIAAVLGVALVLVLNVLAVRTDLHEALCHHETVATGCAAPHDPTVPPFPPNESGDANPAEGCVVTLFAQGHVLAALVFLLLYPIVWRQGTLVCPTPTLALASIDCQWPLGRGPPPV